MSSPSFSSNRPAPRSVWTISPESSASFQVWSTRLLPGGLWAHQDRQVAELDLDAIDLTELLDLELGRHVPVLSSPLYRIEVVVQVAVQEIALELKVPLVTGRSTIERRRGFRVELREGGRVGLGEATPPEEFGHDTAAAAELALRLSLSALSGASLPRSIPELRALMLGLPSLESYPAARHGVELALLDLAAAIRGVPLRVLLSTDARARVG